jgi:hypothetical protein
MGCPALGSCSAVQTTSRSWEQRLALGGFTGLNSGLNLRRRSSVRCALSVLGAFCGPLAHSTRSERLERFTGVDEDRC